MLKAREWAIFEKRENKKCEECTNNFVITIEKAMRKEKENTGCKRVRVASMKREYYETGIAVMRALSTALWTKEECRIVVEYDPKEKNLSVYKEKYQ